MINNAPKFHARTTEKGFQDRTLNSSLVRKITKPKKSSTVPVSLPPNLICLTQSRINSQRKSLPENDDDISNKFDNKTSEINPKQIVSVSPVNIEHEYDKKLATLTQITNLAKLEELTMEKSNELELLRVAEAKSMKTISVLLKMIDKKQAALMREKRDSTKTLSDLRDAINEATSFKKPINRNK